MVRRPLVQGMRGAMYGLGPRASQRWISEVEGSDLGCHDRLTHLTLSSHPKGLPRPKSAGTATQMRQSPSWTRVIQSWWDRNLGRGGSAPSQ